MITKTELVVVGGGPGGYTAAFYAADQGMHVTLIEKSPNLGGVCLNVGCIPSKALLHLAAFTQEASMLSNHGITFDKPTFDLNKMRTFKNNVINKMAGGLQQLSKARNIHLIQGEASFKDANTLSVRHHDGKKSLLSFGHAIIATGSLPVIPDAFKPDPSSALMMDSSAALEITSIPNRLLVIGGGIIGLEMGSVYASFGSKVTVIEALPDIGGSIDKDLVRVLKKKLGPLFHNIHTNSRVKQLKYHQTHLDVSYTKQDTTHTETFDKVLICVGRKPNTKSLCLDKIGVQQSQEGFIRVDKQMRTNIQHLFAIGDVASHPMLAHKASREAHIAVDVVLGARTMWDHKSLPSVIYTDPELAWTGLTEIEAKQTGTPYAVGQFPWAASGRASAIDRNDGLTKILFEPKTERVLGVGIVGVNAGELIAEGCLAIEMGATMTDLSHTIHAHPTLSETLMESAESLHGMATHLYASKR